MMTISGSGGERYAYINPAMTPDDKVKGLVVALESHPGHSSYMKSLPSSCVYVTCERRFICAEMDTYVMCNILSYEIKIR